MRIPTALVPKMSEFPEMRPLLKGTHPPQLARRLQSSSSESQARPLDRLGRTTIRHHQRSYRRSNLH